MTLVGFGRRSQVLVNKPLQRQFVLSSMGLPCVLLMLLSRVDMPVWWTQRRFGVMIQANLATVPAWAPIGEYASWYRAHIDPSAPLGDETMATGAVALLAFGV